MQVNDPHDYRYSTGDEMQTAVAPRIITFETEAQLHDHAEKLNQIGVSPDVPIMDARGIACLACRTAPGGDDWGFAYYMPNTDDGWLQTCDCENCGTEGRASEYNQWRPTFPVTGLVCYDLTGAEGLCSCPTDAVDAWCRVHGQPDDGYPGQVPTT